MRTIKPGNEAERLKLCGALASLEPPEWEIRPDVDGPESLLEAIALWADSAGRYGGESCYLRRLVAHQENPPSALSLMQWRDRLLACGEISLEPLALDPYVLSPVLVITLLKPRKFQRFHRRRRIPNDVREQVLDRDGNHCIVCGSGENLTLDHIIPWSRNGPDTVENLQIMCQSCNSRKGNRS